MQAYAVQVVSKVDPIKYIAIEKHAVSDEISNGLSFSSLLEMICDTKQHSSLLEMKKSWLWFYNDALRLDDLKELNLRTNEEPLPIYVHSSLTPKEEKQYFELPSNVFAQS